MHSLLSLRLSFSTLISSLLSLLLILLTQPTSAQYLAKGTISDIQPRKLSLNGGTFIRIMGDGFLDQAGGQLGGMTNIPMQMVKIYTSSVDIPMSHRDGIPCEIQEDMTDTSAIVCKVGMLPTKGIEDEAAEPRVFIRYGQGAHWLLPP